jgi:PAS domain S-box-containing protein
MIDSSEPSQTLHGDRPALASAQALADRGALAEVAVERTRMPMVVTDPRQADNPIVLANGAFLKLTGYPAAEVIGRNCRFLQGVGTSAAAIEQIRSAIKDEREIDVEILNYRKDGSAFWNQLSLSPVHDDEGKLVYIFGSQIDVTELRKVQALEASERRLLREVDHRARNVLAVVGGIVRLSRVDDPRRYATAVEARVQVLAQAHTLLAEEGWRAVALDRIISQQVSSIGSDRITLEGPLVMAPALVVQPVSLVIHELVENAVTHGALSVPAGKVAVRWGGGSASGDFEIQWREVGGPALSPDAEPGFGSAMVSAMIERQLGGRVERAWGDGGLTVQIQVPGGPRLSGA